MRAAALAAALLLSDAALAQRPSTLNMTCAEAQRYVASRGAAVLGTGGHTYDRFVAAPGFCPHTDYALNAWVPTRDTNRCLIGYRCDPVPPPWMDDGLFDIR
jgi:hypothetical protein